VRVQGYLPPHNFTVNWMKRSVKTCADYPIDSHHFVNRGLTLTSDI